MKTPHATATSPHTLASLRMVWFVWVLSGAAGLGYQAVWTRLFAVGLGHELPSLLAVVTAVFAGLALGAALLGARLQASSRPGHWYAGLEAWIGLWALALTWSLPTLTRWTAGWIGLDASGWRHTTAGFLLPLAALAPATVAMGATFPAMESFLSRAQGPTRVVGAMYAANTLGALAGVLGAAWWLVPALGLRGGTCVLAAINLTCAGLLAWTSRQTGLLPPDHAGLDPTRNASRLPPSQRLGWQACAFATGLLGIGYEILGVRVLSQVLSNTVYAYASVLAVFLAGTALGAWWQQRRPPTPDPAPSLRTRLQVLAAACVTGTFVLSVADPIHAWARSWTGRGTIGQALAEACIAGAVFLPATAVMGSVFSLIVQELKTARGGVGQAVGWNTFGAALAPGCFGAGLLPSLGARGAFALVAAGYALLSALPGPHRCRRSGWAAGVVALTALLATLALSLRSVDLPPGGRVEFYREGLLGNVAVVGEPDGTRLLRVDNRFLMGGTSAVDPQARQAHLPLLLHGQPRRALFLGTGTGITLGAARLHPDLTLDGVELVPGVMEAMPYFAPANRLSLKPDSVQFHLADARRFAALTTHRYDVVVADLFHPARDGAGLLFTREHFQAVRQRLAPGGLFCQWLPLYQMGDRSLACLVGTFLEVFPDAELWLLRFNVDTPVVGLVGRMPVPSLPRSETKRTPNDSALAAELKRLGLANPLQIAGHFLANADALRTFALGAPLNTDLHPRLIFLAPREIPGSRDRLERWLGQPGAARTAALAVGNVVPLPELTAYLQARDVYLRGLAAEADGHAAAAVDAFVESARLSSEFTLGYAQCLTRAAMLVPSDPAAARALLQRLVEAQPNQPAAAELLRRIQ